MINNNLHPSNYINSKSQLNIHKIQLERLLKVTSTLNNSPISLPKFIKKKFSKKLKEKEDNYRINYENSILFNRMLALVKKPSPYNINLSKPIYCPAFDNKNSSYKKSQSIKKIKDNNKFLYNRFLNAKSYYNTSKILKENDFYKYLQGNFNKLYRKIHNLNFCTFERFKENIRNEMKKSDFNISYNANNNNIPNMRRCLNLKRSQSAKNYFSLKNNNKNYEQNSNNYSYIFPENFNNNSIQLDKSESSFNINNSLNYINNNKNKNKIKIERTIMPYTQNKQNIFELKKKGTNTNSTFYDSNQSKNILQKYKNI